MKEQRRIKKKHIDYSCGFPVVLINVPEIKVLNEWIIDIDYDILAKTILNHLIYQKSPLTGNEIRFIRHYFQMTTRQFSALFHIAHTAVTKWEKFGDSSAKILWSTELAIRLFLLEKLSPGSKIFYSNYQNLRLIDFTNQDKSEITLDVKKELKAA